MNKIASRLFLIIFTVLIFCPSATRLSAADSQILKLKQSSYWRGISCLLYDSSLLYAFYQSGLTVFEPTEGFWGQDTLARLPLQHAYDHAFKLQNEILMYNQAGRVGFIFVKYPDQPELISEVDLQTSDCLDLSYYALNLYVACGYAGVEVYNLEDRRAPMLETVLKEPAHAVAVSIHGNYLYVIDDYNGIFIYDLGKDARRPGFLGAILFYHPLKDIQCVDDRAYCAYSDSGIIILDLANPTRPREIGVVKTSGSIIGLSLVGEYLFARNTYGGTEIYYPDSTIRSGEFGPGFTITTPEMISDRTGRYLLYVDSMAIARVSRVSSGWRLKEINSLGEGGRFAALGLKNSVAYVAVATEPIKQVGISQNYNLHPVGGLVSRADLLTQGGGHFFLADNLDHLIWVADRSFSGALIPVQIQPFSDEIIGLQVGDVSDTSLDLATYTSDQVILYQVNEESLEMTRMSEISDISAIAGVFLKAHRLYVSTDSDSGIIFDIDDPANPRMTNRFYWPGPWKSFALAGDTLYAAGKSGLATYLLGGDLPIPLGRDRLGHESMVQIVKSGSRIFCAAGADGILVLGDSSVDSFAVVDRYETPGWANSLALEDSLLIVSDQTGLLLFEIGSNDHPQDHPSGPIPFGYSMGQNYPNPFNQSTIIPIDIPQAGEQATLEIDIYNILGQKVKELVNLKLIPGRYLFAWDGTDDKGRELPSGVYLYRARIGGMDSLRKMVLLR